MRLNPATLYCAWFRLYRCARSSLFLPLCLYLCVCINLGNLHADSMETLLPSDCTWTILIKNDSFSYGLSDNTDDFRSYGMEVRYQWLERHSCSIELSSLTNRAAGSGNEGRYDELRFRYAFHWQSSFQNDRIVFFVSPALGCTVAGNLGFEAAQEFWHSVLDIELLDVVYDTNGQISLHPLLMLGARMMVSEPAPWFRDTHLTLDLGMQASVSALYDTSLVFNALIGQNTGDVMYLRAGAGYAFRTTLDARTTHEAVGDVEQGLMALLDLRLGLLSMVYRWYPAHRIGYGGVGFSFSPNSDNQWKRNDVVLSFGPRFPLEIAATSLRYCVSEDLYATLSNAYTMKMLDAALQVREHLSTWMLGIVKVFSQVEIPFSRPFVSIGIGLQGVEFTRASLNQPGNHEVLYTATSLAAEILAGLQFLGKGEIQANGVSYGFEVGIGARLADCGSIIEDVDSIATGDLAGIVPKNLEPVRFVLRFGIIGGTAL